MEILFTGFEPWGPHSSNPSWDCISPFDKVQRIQLPVWWNVADTHILPQLQPSVRAIILFGLAANRSSISIESRAFNQRDPRLRDGIDRPPPDLQINPAAPPEIPSTLDPTHLLTHLRKAGFPVQPSDDPGRFICNESLFKVLLRARFEPAPFHAVFIHVPPANCLTPSQWTGLPEACWSAVKSYLPA